MGRTEAVVFDLGRVLVDFDHSRGLARDLADHLGIAPAEAVERAEGDPVLRDLFLRFSTGQLPPRSFHEAVCARFELPLSYGRFRERWCAIFSRQPAMEALFEEIAATHRVGLLSDTDPLHWAHLLETVPLLPRIAAPTLSFEIGVMKPSPRAYLRAARNVGLAPPACLFIDDRRANVEGARRAGMEAIHFRDPKTLRDELTRQGLLGAARRGA